MDGFRCRYFVLGWLVLFRMEINVHYRDLFAENGTE